MLNVNWSVKHLKFAPKWSISCFQPILVAIFVTIATVKVELIQDFYTLVINPHNALNTLVIDPHNANKNKFVKTIFSSPEPLALVEIL